LQFVASDPAPFAEVISAMSRLTLLTELCFRPSMKYSLHPAVNGYTALTASTNLCSLQLVLEHGTPERPHALFRSGAVYTQLRDVGLEHDGGAWIAPLSEQQIRQMCSSCPVVESLSFALCRSTTSLLPLLQLTALTRLQAYRLHDAGVAAVAHVAAQGSGGWLWAVLLLPGSQTPGRHCCSLQPRP
jgi:hypothetical protein